MSLRSKLLAARVHRRPYANCARGQSGPARSHSVRSRGLRPNSVTPETAPTLAAVRDKGVNFVNPHALFPAFTMANASGSATGHFLGDTGAFSNTIYTAYPVPTAGGSITPFIENDPILGDIDAHFSGNFVDKNTILFSGAAPGFAALRQSASLARP